MSFQNQGFWMPREAGGEIGYNNLTRIEPKRSRQWIMDGTGTELFSNKKQAIEAHDSRPVPGISHTNVPQWNSTSSCQSLSGEFAGHPFGSEPVRTLNLFDRSIPSVNGGSLNLTRIEPKRSHQWIMDGTGTELFSNKKQAIEAHDSRPVPGISHTNFPRWNSTSSCQSLSGEFAGRSFGSGPVRTVDLFDRSIPSFNDGSLNVGRIEPKRSHQWIMDGTGTELFSNKKQALEAHNCRPVPGISHTNVPQWNSTSSFQSLSGEFAGRPFESEPVQTINLFDRSISSFSGGRSNVGRIEPKRSHQWVVDGTGTELFSNKKQALEAHDCRPVPGISHTNVPQWNSTSSFQSLSGEFAGRPFGSEPVRTLNLFDRSIPSANGESLNMGRRDFQDQYNNASMGLPMSHFEDPSRFNLGGIGKVKVNEVRDSVTDLSGSMGLSYGRGNNNSLSMGTTCNKRDNNTLSLGLNNISSDKNTFGNCDFSFFPTVHTSNKGEENCIPTSYNYRQRNDDKSFRGQSFDKVDRNFLSLGLFPEKGDSNVMSMSSYNKERESFMSIGVPLTHDKLYCNINSVGYTQNKGDARVLSVGHNFNKGETNTMSFGGYQDEPKTTPAGRIISSNYLLIGTQNSAQASQEPNLLMSTQNSAQASQEPSLLVDTQNSALASQEPSSLVGAQNSAPASQELSSLVGSQNSAPALQEPSSLVGAQNSAPASQELSLLTDAQNLAQASQEPSSMIGAQNSAAGYTQDKGDSGVLSMGLNSDKGETNSMPFGGYKDEPETKPSGNIISGYDLLMGTQNSAQASQEPSLLMSTQNSAPASREPSSLVGTQNSAPASQEPNLLIGAQDPVQASQEPSSLIGAQNSALGYTQDKGDSGVLSMGHNFNKCGTNTMSFGGYQDEPRTNPSGNIISGYNLFVGTQNLSQASQERSLLMSTQNSAPASQPSSLVGTQNSAPASQEPSSLIGAQKSAQASQEPSSLIGDQNSDQASQEPSPLIGAQNSAQASQEPSLLIGAQNSAPASQEPSSLIGAQNSAQASQEPSSLIGGQNSAQASQEPSSLIGAQNSAQASQEPSSLIGAQNSAQASQEPSSLIGAQNSGQASQEPCSLIGAQNLAQASQEPSSLIGTQNPGQASQEPSLPNLVEPDMDSTVNNIPVTNPGTVTAPKPKAAKKARANHCFSTVKSLLLTGMLDGIPVKYFSWSREKSLKGTINGAGFLCGCSNCNYTKTINAYEFERHANCKTRHPNNHIYIGNGKTIFGVFQELKNTPRSMILEAIQNVTGSQINQKNYQNWKDKAETSSASK